MNATPIAVLTVFTLLFTVLSADAAYSSTISLSLEHDIAVTTDGPKQKLLRTRFTEEPVIAQVKLDVYALPQMPWTGEQLAELQRLDENSWWQQLQWTLRDASGKHRQIQPRLLQSSVRRRGPAAARPEDRDTSVECSTFHGSFDLGRLTPGDYTIEVGVADLRAQHPLALRTGEEPEVRDVYLRKKAAATKDWLQFKALQLERIERDPKKADALLALAHGSVEHGTLAEAQGYFASAVATMEENMREWATVNPTDATRQAPGVTDMVRRIRALQRVLPEYFAHRRDWRVVQQPSGGYVITTRDTNQVVRRIE